MSFFGPRPPKVPSTVANPLPIQPTLFIPLKPTTTSHTARLECVGTTPRNPEPIHGCPIALQLQKSQPPTRAGAVGSDMESTQPPYMSAIAEKLSREAKLRGVRALLNVTKLVVKLNG